MKSILFKIFKFANKIFKDKGLWKIPFVPHLYGFLYKILTNDELKSIDYDSFNIYGYARDSGPFRVLLFGAEDHVTDLNMYKDFVHNKAIIFDVGANIGVYALVASKSSKRGSIVYAFEPDEKNFGVLEKNIKVNNIKNIKAYKLALSDKKADIKLYRDEYNLGCHSISKDNVPDYKDSVTVSCVTLDDFYEENLLKNGIDLLKMDIQGAELLVLKGARKLLKRGLIKNIYMEYWPKGISNIEGGGDAIKILKDNGFKISGINSSREIVPIEKLKMNPDKYYDIYCTLSLE